jgi:hypothetical protein
MAPCGLAFLLKRAESFYCVRCIHELVDVDVSDVAKRRRVSLSAAVPKHALCDLERRATVSGDPLCGLRRLDLELTTGHDLPDETVLLSLDGADHGPRKHQVRGQTRVTTLREQNARRRWENTKHDLWLPERCVIGSDDDVGRLHDLEPSMAAIVSRNSGIICR